MRTYEPLDVSVMRGVTMASVERGKYGGEDSIMFTADDGRTWRMWYEPDCCASCYITDLAGDLADLVGAPLVMAEEVQNEPPPEGHVPDEYGSETWTFYKFATTKGYVTVRWHGSSNGYYSESVTFEAVLPEDDDDA